MIAKAAETLRRTTKYSVAVMAFVKRVSHATNADVLKQLRRQFPDVSATTIHRVTTRLVDSGKLRLAPPGINNVLRFDANVRVHDHFMCTRCKVLRDADFRPTVVPELEKMLGDDCKISGRITVTGLCKKCANEER